jgi:hypothetical protein
MADAYNVRTDGKLYYVYRLDGNVAVSQHTSGSEAQRSAAVRNQQHTEKFGKKKEQSEAPKPPLEDLPAEQEPQSEKPKKQSKPESQSKAPDPPPGQGVNY